MSLPIGLAVVLHFISPDYLTPLFNDPAGQTMVAGAVIMMVLGGIVMKKMIAIKV
jgi:tight adherence protein B